MYHPTSYLQDWITYINADTEEDDTNDYYNEFDIESQEYIILGQNIDRTTNPFPPSPPPSQHDIDDYIAPLCLLTITIFWIYLYIGLCTFTG